MLLIWLSTPVIALAVFTQIALRVCIFDNKEFMKYFMQTIALLLLWVGILFTIYFLNRPIIDKLFNM